APYLSNANLDFSSSMNFSSWSRTDKDFMDRPYQWKLYSPQRKVFYPSLVTPIRISLSAGGRLYGYEAASQEEPPEAQGSGSSDAAEKPGSELVPDDALFGSDDLPGLDDIQLAPLAQFKGFSYSLSYALRPKFVRQNSYSASMLFVEDTEFDWGKSYSSYYELDSPVDLINGLSFRDRFISLTNTLTFAPHYQRHPDLSGYTSESSKNSVLNADYSAKKFDITDENLISFRPFIYNDVLFDTGLDLKTSVRLLRTKFIGDGENPDWDYLGPKADDQSFKENLLTGYVVAREDEKFSQKFTAATSLAPRAGARDFMVDLTFPFVDFGFSSGVERIDSTDDEEAQFIDKPFKQYLSVKMDDIPIKLLQPLSFTESYIYNREEARHDTLRLAMSFYGLEAAYTMQHAYQYEWDKDDGWTAAEDKEFIPYRFSLSYASQNLKFRYWLGRISWAPSLQTAFVYDMAKASDSYFSFTPAMTFRINRFLYLTFSSESRNSVIFRYFQNSAGYGDVISGEKNPLKDLADSFAFWDLDRRKASGFKVKNFKMTVAHNLHDWTFASSYVFKPRLTVDARNRPTYSYEPYFSFIINWRPMSGLRTQVVDEYGDVQLNP
ncbi:MAG: hypothetical protein IJU95_08045, partial [Treponema sp.]|nr:hypothetical protein [Treponema sp.]